MNMCCLKRYLIMFLAVGLLWSCKKNDEEVKENPPELPPMETMQMDFFKTEKDDFLTSRSSDTHKNWGASASTVVVYNVILSATLAVPVASFRESFNHEGEWQNLGKWKWSYSFKHFNKDYSANLFATKVADGIEWEMVISGNGISNFTWYTGKSNTDGKSGSWVLNASVLNPKPLYNIVWSKSDAGINNIKYTLGAAHKDEGLYVEYGLNTVDSTYDAFYNIVNPNNDAVVNVKWSRENHIGSIYTKGLESNYDGCWNSKLVDISCEER